MRYRLRADTDTDQHSNEVKKSILEHAVEEEVERERERLDKAHETLARTQAQLTSDAVIEEAKARRAFMGAKENVKMEEVRQLDTHIHAHVSHRETKPNDRHRQGKQ